MIMKRGFLLLLLLCWPFVSMAGILEAVENASTELRFKFKSLIEGSGAQYANASDEEKAKAEEQILTAIDEAKKEAETPCPEEAAVERPAETPTETPVSEPKTCPSGSNGTYPNCTCIEEDMIYNAKQNACVVDEIKKKQKAYDEAKAKEQSLANRTLTAITTAAMGIGGKELAQGLAEQSADAAANQDMSAYLETFRCTYGDYQVKGGPDEIELPGANNQTLMNLRAQYFALAADLKERKAALGMKPGIESEVILDKSEMGLYDDENIGITGGAYGSLYRAKELNSEEDQAKLDAEAKASKNRVIGGGIAVGAGAVIGVVGNSLINGKLGEKIKELKDKKSTKENDTIIKEWKKGLQKTGMKNVDLLSLSNFDMTGTKDILKGIKFDNYDLSKFDAIKDIDINNGINGLSGSLGNLFQNSNKKN